MKWPWKWKRKKKTTTRDNVPDNLLPTYDMITGAFPTGIDADPPVGDDTLARLKQKVEPRRPRRVARPTITTAHLEREPDARAHAAGDVAAFQVCAARVDAAIAGARMIQSDAGAEPEEEAETARYPGLHRRIDLREGRRPELGVRRKQRTGADRQSHGIGIVRRVADSSADQPSQ